MPRYAVFGATGNCGTALIEQLVLQPDAEIHAYCRNRSKLATLIPATLETGKVEVFEGQIDDVSVFEECIRGCKAVFLAVSSNTNAPGYHVAEDTAKTLLFAMKRLGADSFPLPKVVVLSSSSLSDNLSRNMPRIAHWVILKTSQYVYEDLRHQEALLRKESSWMTSIFIKPGGLAVDKQRGHKLDLDEHESFVSYADLAAGMIEAANAPDDRYDMKDVTVRNTGGSAKMPKNLPLVVARGLATTFVPWTHRILPTIG